jgi:hypothetical protein
MLTLAKASPPEVVPAALAIKANAFQLLAPFFGAARNVILVCSRFGAVCGFYDSLIFCHFTDTVRLMCYTLYHSSSLG